MDLCVTATRVFVVLGYLICTAFPQPASDQPFLTPQCSNAELLAACQSNFSQAVASTSPDNKAELCKIRFKYLTCTEQAVCTCQYPNEYLMMAQAYKEITRNVYTMSQDNCQTYDSQYTVKPGIWCDQSKVSTYKVSMNTSAGE
ncbi:unnamed protein product [Lymnaea stagnalis]|uniref:Uncharacterized protein n=1 Tax=Lymnaea stagnalis TaxID=6523 RepID=A0AAV2H838_LYMST